MNRGDFILNQTYTVKPGDTLYGISNQYGVSATELAKINNVNANTLQIGTILKIPNTSGTNPNNLFMYTVKKGDTLYSIAGKYNTTVAKIKSLNNLTNNNLTIGQMLKIPETYFPSDDLSLPSYTSYTVKKGDTLYSIAKNNNINIDTLIKDNAITTNNLKIGTILKIRVPSTNEVIEECFGKEYIPPNSQTITYIVKRGDNLYNIAKKYNTTTDSIKKKNNLTSNLLSVGQMLKI